MAHVFVADSSQSHTVGLTGLTYASSGLKWTYLINSTTSVVTLTPVAATLGTWASSGFVEISSTNLPGWYELGIPNVVLASGGPIQMILSGVTNMEMTNVQVNLDTTTNSLLAIGTIAAGIKLVTDGFSFDGSGNVNADANVASNVTVNGYASGQDPATLVLATPANKLTTNSYGQVQHDLTQAVPTSNTVHTVGDALNAARAQGFGKWVISGTTLTLYASDGVTAVRTFTLDSASAPTQRS